MTYAPDIYTPAILLPSTLYAVVGQELNLYWDGILSSLLPLSFYNFDVTLTPTGSDNSQHDNLRWHWTPAVGNIGNATLVLDIWHGPRKVATKTITVTVRAATASSVSRKILMIGDSLITGGQVMAEIVNLCTAQAITPTTVGTKSSTFNDAGSVSRNTSHEGISGKTINFFYTDPTSPFVFNSVFNFATYLSNNVIALSSNDWVLFKLGVNDIFSSSSDSAANTAIATMNTQLQAMITNIKSAVSGIRIGIVAIPACASQDAFGHDYAAGQTAWRYKRNRDLWVASAISNYDGQIASVYLIPAHCALDTVNNMVTANTAFNAYNATTFAKQSNGVHPNTSGYYQIANAIVCGLRGQDA